MAEARAAAREFETSKQRKEERNKQKFGKPVKRLAQFWGQITPWKEGQTLVAFKYKLILLFFSLIVAYGLYYLALNLHYHYTEVYPQMGLTYVISSVLGNLIPIAGLVLFFKFKQLGWIILTGFTMLKVVTGFAWLLSYFTIWTDIMSEDTVIPVMSNMIREVFFVIAYIVMLIFLLDKQLRKAFKINANQIIYAVLMVPVIYVLSASWIFYL